MIIAGAGGFATEMLEVVYTQGHTPIVFYDDVTQPRSDLLFDTFPILHTIDEAKHHFQHIDNRFVLGAGIPAHRKLLAEKMLGVGGVLTSIISADARIGSFGNTILEGVCIMQGAIITNGIEIGRGCLINLNTTIGHGTRIGSFCEIAPGVNIGGNCVIGNYCSLGTNAAQLPHVKIADNVIIGASSLVTRDITVPGTYVGVPAKRIK